MSRPVKRRRDYRTRMILQTLQGSTSADSRGHTQRTFGDRETLWGWKEALSGEEGERARQIEPTATHFVETDYRAHAKPRARFKVTATGALLNILHVDNVEERNRTNQYLCREVVST